MPGTKVEKSSSVHNASHFVFLVWLNAAWKTRSSWKFLCKCSTRRMTTDPAKLGSVLWPRACEQEHIPTFEVTLLMLFSLAFVRNGKYNVTSFSAWLKRTGLLYGTWRSSLNMQIPLNLKLNKHSALRLDKFLSTWGGSALHLFFLAFIWSRWHHLNIILLVHESDVMSASTNPILVTAGEKSRHKQ